MTRTLVPPLALTPSDGVTRLDDAAFGAFYERTSRGLWGYVYRVTGHAADADDIVQEAYCRLLRVELTADEEEQRKYLFRIAGNLIVDRWRRSGKQPPAGDEALAELVAPLAGSPGGDDHDVARTFASLARRDRALLWLAYVEGESHEEIAESLGVGRRSVKVLLFRAKRRLRDLLTSRGIPSRT